MQISSSHCKRRKRDVSTAVHLTTSQLDALNQNDDPVLALHVGPLNTRSLLVHKASQNLKQSRLKTAPVVLQ